MAFLDHHPQLGTAPTTCVAPAVSTLKKAVAHSSAIVHADTSERAVRMIGGSKLASIDKSGPNNIGGSTTSVFVAGNQNSTVTITTVPIASARKGNKYTIAAATSTMTNMTALDAKNVVDLVACEAGAELLYNVCTRDWYVKLVHGKMVSLIEDGNWFHRKSDVVLGRLSRVTRDVVGNCGG